MSEVTEKEMKKTMKEEMTRKTVTTKEITKQYDGTSNRWYFIVPANVELILRGNRPGVERRQHHEIVSGWCMVFTTLMLPLDSSYFLVSCPDVECVWDATPHQIHLQPTRSCR